MMIVTFALAPHSQIGSSGPCVECKELPSSLARALGAPVSKCADMIAVPTYSITSAFGGSFDQTNLHSLGFHGGLRTRKPSQPKCYWIHGPVSFDSITT